MDTSEVFFTGMILSTGARGTVAAAGGLQRALFVVVLLGVLSRVFARQLLNLPVRTNLVLEWLGTEVSYSSRYLSSQSFNNV
jgi:hypothetical protein